MEVVRVRAEAMQKASEEINSGMMTTFLSRSSKLKTAMAAAREYCQQRCNISDPVCKVANYLYPECKVIAGHTEVGLSEVKCIDGRENHFLRLIFWCALVCSSYANNHLKHT